MDWAAADPVWLAVVVEWIVHSEVERQRHWHCRRGKKPWPSVD